MGFIAVMSFLPFFRPAGIHMFMATFGGLITPESMTLPLFAAAIFCRRVVLAGALDKTGIDDFRFWAAVAASFADAAKKCFGKPPAEQKYCGISTTSKV